MLLFYHQTEKTDFLFQLTPKLVNCICQYWHYTLSRQYDKSKLESMPRRKGHQNFTWLDVQEQNRLTEAFQIR